MVLYYLIIFLSGALVGWAIWQILYFIKLQKMLRSISETPKPEIKVVNINLVKMDHAVLAYDKATQMFLGQGKSKQELIDILRTRFPGTNFMVNSQNLRDIYNDTTE